jgi:hypothetical protein
MLGLILATAVVLDSRTSTDPRLLVDQLGSSRYSLRVSAEGELVRLGRESLPALRVGKNSKDAEIRTRSSALLARIENSLLLEATPIHLDFRDVPLPEAIEAINRTSGLGLALAPEERMPLADRRVSLRSNGPLPFWKAIDAFCSAGRLHPMPGSQAGAFLFVDGATIGPAPVSDSGPFRVQLESVHYQSQIQLAQTRPAPANGRGGLAETSPDPDLPNPRANREFFLQFDLTAEPRLSITRNGPIRVTAASDDRGKSLLAPTGLVSFQHTAGYFGMNPTSILHFRVDLNYPDPPAKLIRNLRGVIPVVLAIRKPDPLVVPLAGPRGQVVRNEEVVLTLLEFRPAAKTQPATVQVSIKPLGVPVEPVDHGVGEPLAYRPDSPQQQIELLDAEGRTLSWFPSSTLYNDEETQLTLTVGGRGTSGIPATLRYHGILKATTEVAFEFRDIPIP